MTVDELDKYLAYLPTRKTRSKQKTPTSTSSFYSTENKTQSKKYNGDLKGPRLPSKYNTYSDNRSQQTISFTSFDNDDNVSNGTIRSYQSEPDINNNNAQTTIIANCSNNNVYNNLINSMDNINIYDIENDKVGQTSSNPLHNNHSNYINENNKNDQTNREQQQTNGNIEYENKREHDISQSSTATMRDDNQQIKNNNDNNRNYGYSSNKAQQYKENTYTSNNDKPPIPTFSFGPNNTATNKKNEIPSIPTFSFNNSTYSTNDMPPIPTFSFGDDNDQDDGGHDEISLDLSVSLRCGACDQLINGMAITAAGHRWHTECFKCYHCKQDLEHIAFYVKDQLPYCALDYHELFTTRCDYCHTPIEDKLISALGKNYHVGHLFCRECGKPFDEDSTFMEHDGHPYCEKDYLSKFAQKCKGCKEDITSEFIEALNGKWHLTCFVCVDCGKAFEDNTFYVRNDLPYCERHSLKLKKPL